jgi:NitT/TauT family transport system permease protein
LRTHIVRHVALLRIVLVATTIVVLEALCQSGAIQPVILPAPSDIAGAFGGLVSSDTFLGDLGRTTLTVGISFVIGLVAGLALGILCWRAKLVGDVLEPYLVTLYAMPTLVFYPILLAIMGLGIGPIVVIAALMVLIPVALNTMVALRSVNPVLPKMGRSMGCSRVQLYRRVLLPAATPLAVPGIKLGFIYAIIGTIAMEFMIASKGLGYRIGIDYREFDIERMWGLIVIVATLAIVFTWLMGQLEQRIRKDML